MIQKNELRIGNLVGINYWYIKGGIDGKIYTYHANYAKVIGINDTYAMLEHEGIDPWQGFEFERLTPVPITEELLLSAEFDLNGSLKPCASKDGTFYELFDEWHFTGGESVQFSTPLKYVHQWQNTHFALTGKELTFKISNNEGTYEI